MTETIVSRLMKLNKRDVERYKNYYSKFQLKSQRYVDFIANFTHVHYALRLNTSIWVVLSLVLCRYGLNELQLVGFHYQAFPQDAPNCC